MHDDGTGYLITLGAGFVLGILLMIFILVPSVRHDALEFEKPFPCELGSKLEYGADLATLYCTAEGWKVVD